MDMIYYINLIQIMVDFCSKICQSFNKTDTSVIRYLDNDDTLLLRGKIMYRYKIDMGLKYVFIKLKYI